jgi:putative transposase
MPWPPKGIARSFKAILWPTMCYRLIEIPQKHKVSEVVSFLKVMSTIAIATEFGGKECSFTGVYFWARGYAVGTVGLEEEVI